MLPIRQFNRMTAENPVILDAATPADMGMAVLVVSRKPIPNDQQRTREFLDQVGQELNHLLFGTDLFEDMGIEGP